jgi:hypothetical protein
VRRGADKAVAVEEESRGRKRECGVGRGREEKARVGGGGGGIRWGRDGGRGWPQNAWGLFAKSYFSLLRMKIKCSLRALVQKI